MRNRKQLILTGRQYSLLRGYFMRCHKEGFTGRNDYSRINRDREYFYRWHLDRILQKFNKPKGSDLVYVLMVEPELMTVNAMFQRVDCDSEIINLQGRFKLVA